MLLVREIPTAAAVSSEYNPSYFIAFDTLVLFLPRHFSSRNALSLHVSLLILWFLSDMTCYDGICQQNCVVVGICDDGLDKCCSGEL